MLVRPRNRKTRPTLGKTNGEGLGFLVEGLKDLELAVQELHTVVLAAGDHVVGLGVETELVDTGHVDLVLDTLVLGVDVTL